MFEIFFESKNSFDGMLPGEVTSRVVRAHWFVPIVTILSSLFALFVPLVLVVVVGAIVGIGGFEGLILLGYSLYTLLVWFFTFYMLMIYSLDVLIITNMRIIQSRQRGFFSRTVSELSFAKIQDVTVDIHGLIPTLLNFGDLKVQSAGTETYFKSSQIPHPEIIKDEILALVKGR